LFVSLLSITPEQFTYFKYLTTHNYILGLTPEQCFELFVRCYDGLVPEFRTVQGWYRQIDRTGTLFTRSVIVGRPRDPSLSSAIRAFLESTPSASTKAIAAALGRTKETIKNRLVLDMGYKKYGSRWIPHQLNKSQKERRVDMAIDLLERLEEAQLTGFVNLLTSGESWISYLNRPRAQWLPAGSTPPDFPKTRQATLAHPTERL
jgi:hypothetical protein